MYRKNIRTITRKQLKKEYPNWNRLTKKEKKHCFRNWPAHGKKQYSQKKRPTDSASLCCLRFPMPDILRIGSLIQKELL